MATREERIQERTRDLDKLVEFAEKRVAQEGYGPLKHAVEVIGILNTGEIGGQTFYTEEYLKKGGTGNPFDSDLFVREVQRHVRVFCEETGAGEAAVNQILNLIDSDLQRGNQLDARMKIADLSIFFMDQTMRYLKRTYPW